MIDDDNGGNDDNDWQRWLWRWNVAMENVRMSLVLIINRKDFELAYTVGHYTRARLGCVKPLGRPRSVYKSDVGCCFLMAKWPWRSRSMPQISIPAERMPRCIFGANFVILSRIHEKLPSRQAKFPRILSQNGQMTLKVRVNDRNFNTSREYHKMHVWCQFGDSSPNLWQVIAQTNRIS